MIMHSIRKPDDRRGDKDIGINLDVLKLGRREVKRMLDQRVPKETPCFIRES